MEVAYSKVTDPPTGVEMHSALDDPYPHARDDVRDALQKLQKLHEEWKRMLRARNPAENQHFHEVRANISSELQDLTEDVQGIALAIKAVEDNRQSFPVDDAEMSRRRDFLRTSEASLQDMGAYVKNPKTLANIEAFDRESQVAKAAADAKAKAQAQASAQVPKRQEEGGGGVELEADGDFLRNDEFLGREMHQQQQIRAEQDDYMVDIGKSAARLKEVASTMNTEINYQNNLLEDLDEDIEKETEHLNSVMKNVGRLLQTSDRSQLYVIIALCVLFAILLFFVIV